MNNGSWTKRLGLIGALWASSLAVSLAISLAVSRSIAEEPPRGEEKPRANRLAKESSPYLLLHAHNPVDWHPWGEEALDRARREKKLIFLSIGYSSCHWCHVMERESFSDRQIAEFLNQHFVCIKVDREERPDIDEIYMRSLQIYFQLTGSRQTGGWPLSVFLAPDGKPLAGGTYFPPRDVDGRLGFLTVISRLQQAWAKEPEKVQATGELLADALRESMAARPDPRPLPLEQKLVDQVEADLFDQFDSAHGGFGFNPNNFRTPKFPETPNLVFLLSRLREGDHPRAKEMLLDTLDRMGRGGIRDHAGGGFHRYSTDRYWRIPHFEKMLQDNAQLVGVYALAFAAAGRQEDRRAADEIARFMLRELRDPAGAFYTAIDAETAGREGDYYTWTREELQQTLGKERFALAAAVYALGGEPNFEGRFVLYQPSPLAEVARRRATTENDLLQSLRSIHDSLLELRSGRPRPLTDTKILAAANGLAIRGLADAGRVLKNEQYLAAAKKAAEFVLAKLRRPDGRLLRTYGAGQAKLNAYLDDYVFLADGLIALHQATGERVWLDEAARLLDLTIEWFWDEQGGGFFFTSRDHEQLVARSKIAHDGATPAGNSVAAADLVYLATALARPDYAQRAEKTIQSSLLATRGSLVAAPQTAAALADWLRMAKPAPPR